MTKDDKVKLYRVIWQKAIDLGFQFNETDAWEMMDEVRTQVEPEKDMLLDYYKFIFGENNQVHAKVSIDKFLNERTKK